MNFKIEIDTRKNLLAFSAGIDSTALFFILLDKNIEFDIAIVNYGLRDLAAAEVEYAKELALKYKKKCFIADFPDDISFSEKNARDFRYKFFDKIIKENNYEALITAHQLNDKLEWFLMQLTRGAGLGELIGINETSYRNGYVVLKPLLKYTKEELQHYLDNNRIRYFIDETNIDISYKRNYFRHEFSDKMISKYKDGIKKSFEYLQNDMLSLQNLAKKVYEKGKLCIYEYSGDENIAIRIIDNELKKRGILITKSSRDEILKQKEIIISDKIAVSLQDLKIFIAPKSSTVMDKKFKEECRLKKIPKNIRAYLKEASIDLDEIVN